MLRFILENIDKYPKSINFSSTDDNELNKTTKKIINDTIKYMRECKNSDLDILILNITKEYNIDSNNFINNFTQMLKIFNYGLSNKFDLKELNIYKNDVKRFWFLLNKIYVNLQSINQNLCEYIDDKSIDKSKEINQPITLELLEKFKKKYKIIKKPTYL